jgi:hypothetical protein
MYREEEEEEEEKEREEITTQPPENIRWLFDYEFLYTQIEAYLRGEALIYNPKYESYTRKKVSEPLLNDKGIQEVMTLVRSQINMLGALSYYDEERVYLICKYLHIDLANLLFINAEEFDVKPHKIPIICDVVINNVEHNLRRSLGAMGLKSIITTERVIETRVEPKKKKWLPF